VWFSV